jgi:hypothetical protein
LASSKPSSGVALRYRFLKAATDQPFRGRGFTIVNTSHHIPPIAHPHPHPHSQFHSHFHITRPRPLHCAIAFRLTTFLPAAEGDLPIDALFTCMKLATLASTRTRPAVSQSDIVLRAALVLHPLISSAHSNCNHCNCNDCNYLLLAARSYLASSSKYLQSFSSFTTLRGLANDHRHTLSLLLGFKLKQDDPWPSS